MKKNESQVIYTFIIAVITALAIIAGIFVGMSQVLVNSKYGFIAMIFIGATVAVCAIVQHHDKAIFKDYSEQYNLIKKENESRKEYIIELAKQRDDYKTQLEYYTSGAVKEEYDTLKQKAEALETFRNSFPLKIAENYLVYAIIRTEVIVGKCSKWHIVGAMGNELWDCSIMRPETQSYKDMITLISATADYNGVAELDQSTAILWK